LTGTVASGAKEISQSFDGACLVNFTQTEKDAKAAVKNVFKFNWIDINPSASQIDVTGDKMFLELISNEKEKLIMNTKDDKFSGYDNDIKIYMPDIENARRAKFSMEKLIEKCKASYKEPFGNDAASMNKWIVSNIKDQTLEDITLKQVLEPVETGNMSKFKYTIKELNAKGSGSEQVYEFNLSDMNPLSVAVEVKGKWLYVTMDTEFKGKIIKYYKDGKIQPYANSIQFAINDVDASRNMISALKKSIKLLKGK
jgi:hypothetical protein